MQLVIFTSAVAVYLAPGPLHPLLGFTALVCIALGAAASAAINNSFDVDIDRRMARTRLRPTASGRIEPAEALAIGVTLAIIGVMVMGLALNWLAAALLAGTIAFYVFVYTMWLKRRTPQNIVIGGAAGALPPVVAWAAVTGDVALLPVLLFAIIFLWTPPHFWALALYRTDDYDRVGVPMLPVVAGRRSTLDHILAYTVLLVLVTLLPVALGLAGWSTASWRSAWAACSSATPSGCGDRIVTCWRCAPSASRSSTCSRCSPASPPTARCRICCWADPWR